VVRAKAGRAGGAESVEIPRRRPPRSVAAAAAGVGWAQDAPQRDDATVALPMSISVPNYYEARRSYGRLGDLKCIQK
jgi:hypothetical protein